MKKKEVLTTMIDEFGNMILLKANVCPLCLQQKSKYSEKCANCNKKTAAQQNT